MFKISKHIILQFVILLLLLPATGQANPEIHTITPNADSIAQYTKLELKVTLSATFSNPYDYTQVRLKGYFTSPSGTQIIMDGFYMQDYAMTAPDVLTPSGPPEWRIRFSPDESGTWTYFVRIWDETGFEHSESLQFTCIPSDRKGFVSLVDEHLTHRNGETFLGLGTNMAWQDWSSGFTKYEAWLDALDDNGGNFVKLTLAPWGFEFEWQETGPGQYDERQNRAWTLDWVMDLLMEREIYCQLNPMIHDELRNDYASNWYSNPYNTVNGGPCTDPQDFLVNPSAITLYKNKLRYINARWGYSPQVVLWEQLSEADNTGIYDNFYSQTLSWLNIMTEYMNNLDKYNRLCSSAYAIPQHDPNYWDNAETGFTQLHIYDFIADLEMKIYNFSKDQIDGYDKPFVVGEFAMGHDPSVIKDYDPDGISFHNTVWSSMFSGSFATAMSWWWDNYLYPNGLFDHLKAVSDFFMEIDEEISRLEPAVLLTTSDDYDMIEIDPDYNNDGDKAPENYFHFGPSGLLYPTELYLGEYLYGSFYNSRRNPPTFQVNFTKDGYFKVNVGDLAVFAKLRVRLDGITVFDQTVSPNSLHAIFIPEGEHEIRVDNSATGIIKVDEYEFHDYAPNLRAFAYESEDYIAGWLQNRRYNWEYLSEQGIPNAVSNGKIYPDFDNQGTYMFSWYNQDAVLDSTQTIVFSGDDMVVDAPNIVWDGAFEGRFLGPFEVAFSSSVTDGDLPLAVQFTDESTVYDAEVDAWNWDFGDGNTSTAQNPEHIYTAEGVYTVTLEIVSGNYAVSLVKENLIEVVQPLVADFVADTTLIVPGTPIQFTDLSLGNPDIWLWSFGDNTLSFSQNPVHTFDNPGIFTVSLFVENENRSDTETKENYIEVLQPVQAGFSSDISITTVGGEIFFSDLSTGEPDYWLWDFGDGTTSEEQHPSKSYQQPGVFSVKLILGNNYFEDSLLATDFITVLQPLTADFDAEPRLAWQGQDIQFQDISQGNPESWHWDFGNGITSEEQNPLHSFDDAGLYAVKLMISDTLQADSIFRENFIHIRDTLDADFVVDTPVITITEKAYFSDISKGDPHAWFWLFGDGFSSQQQNPSHRFKYTGDFTITMQASRNDTTDTEVKTNCVKVIPELVANFTTDTLVAVPGESIYFIDMSTGNPDTWIWDFGDSTVGLGQNTTTSYANPGNYTVKLIASNTYLSDTLVQENLISIIEPVVASFTANPLETIIGEEVQFTDLSSGFPTQWEWWLDNGDAVFSQNPAATYYTPGFYDITLIAGNTYFSDTLTVEDFLHVQPPYYNQQISIRRGWSGISTYVDPVFDDVTTVFGPVEETLFYAFNEQGIYSPVLDINTIGNWDADRGMVVYLSEPDTLLIEGYQVVGNTLVLHAGWSFFPVPIACPHTPDILETQLGNNFKVLKEIGSNKVYWPDMGIFTLETLRPGEMYLIYMENEQQFIFPACD